ncbi:DEKNAAC102384 [Brettanomyces naardenensis]|uniref:Mediator of RNA polymerase II transcription subunit 1 n=1 Tax=Brettanomyces naardenensis TaxID=13370 RepID=A0A448YLA2_BRENA|nr:DEKNAAC102384 [Brettanomyces naardenensis]
MPTVDPELLAPLSKISEILLKRPGKVSLESIKRLSNIYGFETFTDTLALEDNAEGGSTSKNLVYTIGSHAGTPMNQGTPGPLVDRLSLSGKILLIDIDFLEGIVKNVSISSAINLQPIDGETYDFLEGWRKFEPVGKILLRNLQSSTLDQFNKNLRILSQFDRLSMNPPDDLFNLFNQLTYNLVDVYRYQKEKLEENLGEYDSDQCCPLSGEEVERDLREGCGGIGQILMNQQNKIGLFLKIWEDNRFVSRRLDEIKKVKTVESLNPYLIHFKITENIHGDAMEVTPEAVDGESIDESGAAGMGEAGDNDNADAGTGTAAVTQSADTPMDVRESGPAVVGGGKGTGLKVKWFDNGDWLINSNDTMLNANLNLLVLELCPSIWIPKDLPMELGLQDYEVRSTNNNFFNNNQQDMEDPILDRFYSQINRSHSIDLKLESGRKLRVSFLVGCPMVKIFKITFNRLNRLSDLVVALRNWCLLNSVMRKLLIHADQETNFDGSAKRDGEDNKVDANNSPANAEDGTDDENELANIDEDLRLDDVMKEYSGLLEAESNDVNGTDIISIGNLQLDEVMFMTNNHSFKIKNGIFHASDIKGARAAQVLTKTEELAEVLYASK